MKLAACYHNILYERLANTMTCVRVKDSALRRTDGGGQSEEISATEELNPIHRSYFSVRPRPPL